MSSLYNRHTLTPDSFGQFQASLLYRFKMEMIKTITVGILLLALVLAAEGCVHNGIEYKEGETYIDDCNTCTCGKNGAAMCHQMGCPPKVCEYLGKMYGVGEQYMDVDGCNRCTCDATGNSACTYQLCV